MEKTFDRIEAGKALRQYRRARNVTLQEVADELGVAGPPWVWRRERGVSLTEGVVKIIEGAVDCVVERRDAGGR